MKKLFSVVMVLVLSFSLSACCLFPWWNPPQGGGPSMGQPQPQGGGMKPMQQPRR